MAGPTAIGQVAAGLGSAAGTGWTLQSLMPLFQQVLGIAPMLVDDEKKRNEMMKVLKGHAAGASLGDIAGALVNPMLGGGKAAGDAAGKATGKATGNVSFSNNNLMKMLTNQQELNNIFQPGALDLMNQSGFTGGGMGSNAGSFGLM